MIGCSAEEMLRCPFSRPTVKSTGHPWRKNLGVWLMCRGVEFAYLYYLQNVFCHNTQLFINSHQWGKMIFAYSVGEAILKLALQATSCPRVVQDKLPFGKSSSLHY